MKKNRLFLLLGLFILAFITGCNKTDSNNTCTLVFKGVKPFSVQKSAKTGLIKSSKVGSNTHVMHTANFKGFITEIWVSQDLVAEGISDDFKWYKIGESNELKLFEEYSFSANDLPAGDYKSIKMVFKNTITRIAVYQSDINKTVEMSGSLSEEGCADNTLITQYFSKRGNHSLGQNGLFYCASGGETVRGFKVKPDEITTIYWRLGNPDSKITDCTFEWIDVNGNNAWDCGIDQTDNFSCINETPMFSFSVDDGEEDPVIRNAVTDIDGNTYNAVKIGNQIWMQEDLKTTRLNDGTYLMIWEEYKKYLKDNPPAPPPVPMPQTPPLRSIINNSPNLPNISGYLYSWTAIKTGKLCPYGWHVPTDNEWETLVTYLGKNAGGKLKETGIWNNPNEGATNESEFTALPGGGLLWQTITGPFGSADLSDFRYIGVGKEGYWWSSTDKWGRRLTSTSNEVIREQFNKTSFSIMMDFVGELQLSCRCIKD
jgi:uncharacterized protein (TIGR02145 family)